MNRPDATTLRVPWEGSRQCLILEPRFIVGIVGDDEIRVTAAGSVVLTLEEAARLHEALGLALGQREACGPDARIDA